MMSIILSVASTAIMVLSFSFVVDSQLELRPNIINLKRNQDGQPWKEYSPMR